MRRASLDGDAFVQLYRSHAEDVLAFFARRTLDAEAAADLTAETFAQAFASRDRFRDTGRGPGPWLFGIARHQLLHYYRRGRIDSRARARLGLPRTYDLSEQDVRGIEELMGLETISDSVREQLASLPAGERAAVVLRVLDSRPYPEVARQLGCSERAARARVSRGLRRLEAQRATT